MTSFPFDTAWAQLSEKVIISERQQIYDGRFIISKPWDLRAYFNKLSRVTLISFSKSPNQSSTSSFIITGDYRGTYSFSELIIDFIFVLLSAKSTLKMPAKSFLRWVWITTGFLA